MTALLDDQNQIAKIDRSNMLRLLASFPDMLKEAELIGEGWQIKGLGKIEGVVIAGMGGSAMGGEVAACLAGQIPILINRNYVLPEYLGPKNLLIATSYSGNTEETLSCVKEARQKKMPVICLSSGGKLAEIAKKEAYPLVNCPPGLPPRAALPYLAVIILKALEKLELVTDLKGQIGEAIKILADLKVDYTREERSNSAKLLARKLVGKIPLILTSCGMTEVAGKRFKTQFNENSKLTAHQMVFPEMDHNEIENLAALKRGQHDFVPLLLRDEEDHYRVQKSIEIVKSLVGANLGGMNEISSRGKSRLARLLSLIYLGDYLSVYLALLRSIDPTPVEAIVRFKKENQR